MTKLEEMTADLQALTKELRSPRSVAELFCEMDSHQQAAFFGHVASIASAWTSDHQPKPGEYQAVDIGKNLRAYGSDAAIAFLTNIVEGAEP